MEQTDKVIGKSGVVTENPGRETTASEGRSQSINNSNVNPYLGSKGMPGQIQAKIQEGLRHLTTKPSPNLDKALELLHSAETQIKHAEKSDPNTLKMILKGLCCVYKGAGKPRESLMYATRVLQVEKWHKDPLGIAQAYINVGTLVREIRPNTGQCLKWLCLGIDELIEHHLNAKDVQAVEVELALAHSTLCKELCGLNNYLEAKQCLLSASSRARAALGPKHSLTVHLQTLLFSVNDVLNEGSAATGPSDRSHRRLPDNSHKGWEQTDKLDHILFRVSQGFYGPKFSTRGVVPSQNRVSLTTGATNSKGSELDAGFGMNGQRSRLVKKLPQNGSRQSKSVFNDGQRRHSVLNSTYDEVEHSGQASRSGLGRGYLRYSKATPAEFTNTSQTNTPNWRPKSAVVERTVGGGQGQMNNLAATLADGYNQDLGSWKQIGYMKEHSKDFRLKNPHPRSFKEFSMGESSSLARPASADCQQPKSKVLIGQWAVFPLSKTKDASGGVKETSNTSKKVNSSSAQGKTSGRTLLMTPEANGPTQIERFRPSVGVSKAESKLRSTSPQVSLNQEEIQYPQEKLYKAQA